ncbi:ankyrin repeat domain-containing protein [Candidatus Babeliales bacterium]|nr:ankyrin repeat domain-containing protein [Candidatus Babeliales bacterium]
MKNKNFLNHIVNVNIIICILFNVMSLTQNCANNSTLTNKSAVSLTLEQATNLLFQAVLDGNFNQVCTAIQKHKANVNAVQNNVTPLDIASAARNMKVSHKTYTKIFTELLRAGANPNTQDADGFSPAHWAVFYRSKEKILILSKYNADLSIPDKRENTPLHWAIIYNDIETCEILIQLNANLLAKNSTGQTIMDAALGNRIITALCLQHNKFLQPTPPSAGY